MFVLLESKGSLRLDAVMLVYLNFNTTQFIYSQGNELLSSDGKWPESNQVEASFSE